MATPDLTLDYSLQETQALWTENGHTLAARGSDDDDVILGPEIITVRPRVTLSAGRRYNSNWTKSFMWRLFIVFICICIIIGIVYSRYSKKSSTIHNPSTFYNDLESTDPNFKSKIGEDYGDNTDLTTVENIKKSRLWDGQICYANECNRTVVKFREYVDHSVDPCEDFYGFVCGNFDKLTERNESISSALQLLRQNVQQQLKSIMMEPPKSQDAHSVVLVKKYFSSCMDFATMRVKSNDKIVDLIQKLGGWPLLDRSWDSTSFSWMNTTKNARRLGLSHDWFVDFTTDEEGDGILPKIAYPMPDLDIYFQISDDDFRQDYLSLMVDAAVYYGASKKKAKQEMTRVLEFEEKLYENVVEAVQSVSFLKKLWSTSKANDDLSSYGTTTISRISTNVDHPWFKFVQDMVMSDEHHIRPSSEIVFRGHDYFDYLDSFLDSDIRNRTAQNYFIWKTLFSLADYLPELLRIRFEVFRSRTVSFFREIETDRSGICFQSTNLNLFKAIEAEYVRRFVNADTKNEIKYLISLGKKELIKMIDEENYWIDYLTKLRLVYKTQTITEVIGGLDVMFDKERYDKQLGLDKFEFSSSNVIDMFRELQLKRLEETFSKLYYKYTLTNYVEKFLTGWTTINAQYHMASNTILLSAATLQGDMYTRGRPNYLNLGAIGSFMSHELSHGIDTSVGFYISQGKLIPWLTLKAKFLNSIKTACITDEYDFFLTTHPYLGLNTNGTVSENIADFVGVDLAYRIYQNVISQQGKDPFLSGMSQSPNQLFWMQLASMWCSSEDSKSDLVRQLGLDEHAFPEFRVNGPLRNSRYFARDFGCSDNSYMNPPQKCRVL